MSLWEWIELLNEIEESEANDYWYTNEESKSFWEIQIQNLIKDINEEYEVC